MPVNPTLNTQVIGQAESALGAILDPILAAARTSFEQWLVLTVTAGSGGSVEQAQLVSRITAARKIGDDVVLAAVRDLSKAGLVALPPETEPASVTGPATGLTLTPEGQERYQQIRARINAVTGRLFGDIPASDLETAGRVLSIVTSRATAEVAAARPGSEPGAAAG